LNKRLNLALLVAMLAAVLVPAALARPVLDEPAGKGGPPPSSGCFSPTLTGPTEARVGESYTVSGCGFAPGSMVPLEITEAGGCCGAVNRVADSAGAFSYSGSVWGAGTYRVRASVRRNNNRWRVAASWSFQATG
jgi:hypothetical protein